MKKNRIKDFLDDAGIGYYQRKLIEFALKLQGCITFDDLHPYNDERDAEGVAIAQDLICEISAVKDVKGYYGNIYKRYLPVIDAWYYQQLLGITLEDGKSYLINGNVKCRYREASDRFWYDCDWQGAYGDRGLLFLCKASGKAFSELLSDYYNQKWGYKSSKLLENVKCDWLDDMPSVDDDTIAHVESMVEIDLDDDTPLNPAEAEEDTYYDIFANYDDVVSETATTIDELLPIDVLNFKPKRLGRYNAHHIHDWSKSKTGDGWAKNRKLKNGAVVNQDHIGRYSDGKGGWYTAQRSYRECQIIDGIKDWYYERNMHRAVNQPKDGWSYSLKHNAALFIGYFCLTASKSTPKTRCSMLYRFMDKKPAKKFCQNSLPIPYLLENLNVKRKEDRYIFVCEGVADACFIRNGIALNCWKESERYGKPIIDYFANRKRACTIVYITDNWCIGDKGGLKALEWAKQHDPDRLMFDWGTITTKSKDVCELVNEKEFYTMVDTLGSPVDELGNPYLLTRVYELPRDYILAHARKASEITVGEYYDIDIDNDKDKDKDKNERK